MIFAIEVTGKKALLLHIDGAPLSLSIQRPKEKFEIPDQDDSIQRYIDLQKNFELYLQNHKPEFVVLCEGGAESQKSRIRMEFSILISCANTGTQVKSYPTNSASKYINTGFSKDFGSGFEEYFTVTGLPQGFKRLLASAIRHLK